MINILYYVHTHEHTYACNTGKVHACICNVTYIRH